MSILGDNLQREMDRQGIKQEQLAAAVGVTQPAIAKIIKGITLKPRNLPDIARALSVTIDSLLGIEESQITNISDNPKHERVKALLLQLDEKDVDKGLEYLETLAANKNLKISRNK